jgi:hypothetical protein
LIQGCKYLALSCATCTCVGGWSLLSYLCSFLPSGWKWAETKFALAFPLQTPFARGFGGSELMRLPRLSDLPWSLGDIGFIIESPSTHLTACVLAPVSVRDNDNRFLLTSLLRRLSESRVLVPVYLDQATDCTPGGTQQDCASVCLVCKRTTFIHLEFNWNGSAKRMDRAKIFHRMLPIR